MSKREAYCKRTIVANYSGLLGGNEMFNNSTLYWYIPKEEESMLKFDMIGKKEVPSDLVGYKKYECVLKDNSTEEDRSLTYTIKEYYSPKAAKNTIKCILQSSVIDSYTAEKSFTFASYGNNGTEYSIFVRPLDEDITTVSPNRNLSLLISAYDYEGKQIDLDPSSMSIIWSKDYKEQLELNKIDKDLYIIIPYVENKTNYGHLTITLHGIKLSNGSNKDITTEYAIPYSTIEGCKLIGATKIIYNSFGTEPVCDDNTPYAVYGIDDKELDLSELTLSHNDYCILNSDNTLKANTMYTSSSNGYPILVIISADSPYPVWNQEIIVAQNRFGIPAVNDWDGEYGINDNGHVFAAMLGVGQKDVNNRFTGMVMGEIGELKNNAQWGLYGFDKGVGTYGFRTDGSAFIGADENNCIKVIQDNGKMSLHIKLNKLTLSAGLSDTDTDNDFYLSNYETHNIDKRLVIGSNFAVDTKGNITANGGTIGGITINKDCLTS
jgi:hypothetical protein